MTVFRFSSRGTRFLHVIAEGAWPRDDYLRSRIKTHIITPKPGGFPPQPKHARGKQRYANYVVELWTVFVPADRCTGYLHLFDGFVPGMRSGDIMGRESLAPWSRVALRWRHVTKEYLTSFRNSARKRQLIANACRCPEARSPEGENSP
jgi:hypothetical protein